MGSRFTQRVLGSRECLRYLQKIGLLLGKSDQLEGIEVDFYFIWRREPAEWATAVGEYWDWAVAIPQLKVPSWLTVQS